jgi:hypothetical protein
LYETKNQELQARLDHYESSEIHKRTSVPSNNQSHEKDGETEFSGPTANHGSSLIMRSKSLSAMQKDNSNNQGQGKGKGKEKSVERQAGEEFEDMSIDEEANSSLVPASELIAVQEASEEAADRASDAFYTDLKNVLIVCIYKGMETRITIWVEKKIASNVISLIRAFHEGYVLDKIHRIKFADHLDNNADKPLSLGFPRALLAIHIRLFDISFVRHDYERQMGWLQAGFSHIDTFQTAEYQRLLELFLINMLSKDFTWLGGCYQNMAFVFLAQKDHPVSYQLLGASIRKRRECNPDLL